MHDTLPPATRHLLLVLYLLPCALQDHRRRRVSNWLTVPAFFVAWPLALWTGDGERLFFVCAVFTGCWVAWRVGGMGGADGKLAVLAAAVDPAALGLGTIFLALGFLAVRARHGEGRSLPAAVALYLGAVVAFFLGVVRNNAGHPDMIASAWLAWFCR